MDEVLQIQRESIVFSFYALMFYKNERPSSNIEEKDHLNTNVFISSFEENVFYFYPIFYNNWYWF